ncbi:MAG: DUF4124 domain-containing protein [Betaproteobacteria bacterium]|nr:MAG: DUF4124 domain-containing protein [Betaproteobacteria bacterium]
MARDYRSKMARVRLFAALLFVIPLAASATIYQWTDEQEHVVFGNQVPETGARNVHAVMKEDPAAPVKNNRELEERIARLERQVQAAQVASAPAPYPIAPTSYPAAPPPMPAGYYGAPYYPGMYPPPPYYPYGYAYPFAVVTVARPVRFSSRPFISFHHAAIHRR